MSRGIQRAYMSLMSVFWTLFKSVSKWGTFHLDYTLKKGDRLLKSLNNYSYLENVSINVEFLDNRREEIIAVTYLLSMTEIVSDCQQIGKGALSIVNNYIIGLL